jgi:hypothetical protein
MGFLDWLFGPEPASAAKESVESSTLSQLVASQREADNLLAEIEEEEARQRMALAAMAGAAADGDVDSPELRVPPRHYGAMTAYTGGSKEKAPTWELGIEKRGGVQSDVTAVYVRCPFCQQLHVHGWPMSNPPTLAITRWSRCEHDKPYRIVGFWESQKGYDGGPANSGPVTAVA